ncbi:hypothetical protein GOODEAATRI_016619 [Goodea atripinnis]|uniref:Uncharacterized protein n=1 Tax=Goodea atripinnis TaxID=208336 RepID=A0ABV0NV64_9TELE
MTVCCRTCGVEPKGSICVILSSLRNTMNPVKATVLFVLLGLLVLEISCQKPKTPEEEVAFLKVRLALVKDRYRLLCNQYSSLANNCSAPGMFLLQAQADR